MMEGSRWGRQSTRCTASTKRDIVAVLSDLFPCKTRSRSAKNVADTKDFPSYIHTRKIQVPTFFEGLTLETLSDAHRFGYVILWNWAVGVHFQYKTLGERRCLKFLSEDIHDKNFLASAAFGTERERVLYGKHDDSRGVEVVKSTYRIIEK